MLALAPARRLYWRNASTAPADIVTSTALILLAGRNFGGIVIAAAHTISAIVVVLPPLTPADLNFRCRAGPPQNGSSAVWFNFYSNGFSPINTDSDSNENGMDYVYAAFADHPFKYSNAH